MRKRAILAVVLFIAALISSYFALEAYANVKLKEKIDRRFRKLPYAISYSNFHYSLASNDIEIDGLSINGDLFSVKFRRIFIDLPFDFRKKRFPPYLKINVDGGNVSLNLPTLRELLGESRFNFNVHGWYSFKNSRFSTFFQMDLPDLCEFQITSTVENLSYPVVERFFEGRTTVNSLINRGQLSRFRFVFKNGGIFERFLKYTAEQEGSTPGRVKEELLSTVSRSFHDRMLYESIGKPLEDFVRNPVCIELELKPQVPVELRDLKKMVISKPDLKEIVQKLGVELHTCS